MMKSTNDRGSYAPKSGQTPLYAELADQYLSEKHFLLIPSPLVEWLWHAPLRPTSKDLFLVYWNDAMARKRPGQPLISRLSVAFAAKKLGASEVAVRKANQELRKLKLIDRVQQNNAIGRTVSCQTVICLPESLARHLAAAPNRGKYTAPHPTPFEPSSEGSVEEVSMVAPLPVYPAAMQVFSLEGQQEPKPIVKPAKQVEQASKGKQTPNETDGTEIERLEQRRDELNQRILSGHTKDLDTHEKVVRELAAIQERLRLLRSPEPPSASPKTSQKSFVRQIKYARGTSTKPIRQLGEKEKGYIRKRLADIGNLSSPKEVFNEVVFHVTQGAYSGGSIPVRKAINISLKLIRTGRWRTPAGYGGHHREQAGIDSTGRVYQ